VTLPLHWAHALDVQAHMAAESPVSVGIGVFAVGVTESTPIPGEAGRRQCYRHRVSFDVNTLQ